jgi:hypothetical protein
VVCGQKTRRDFVSVFACDASLCVRFRKRLLSTRVEGVDFRNRSRVTKMGAAAVTSEAFMLIYITQGRYTREAAKGIIVKPEDRAEFFVSPRRQAKLRQQLCC